MKVRERIETITDLLLGAVHADRHFDASEASALQHMLCDLLLCRELPPKLTQRIAHFSPERFDLQAAAREFRRDPPMRPRRLLELVLALCTADGEFDFEEDEYLHRLGRALDLDPVEYDDLVIDYEVIDPSARDEGAERVRTHASQAAMP